MIKKNICITVIMVLIFLLLSGCNTNSINQPYVYDDINYSVGNKAFENEITEVNIDWILGNVIVQKSENEKLIIREDVSINIDSDYKMHYLLTDSSLDIRFTKSFENLKYKFGVKNLMVYLPKELETLNINCDSADIKINDVKIKTLNIKARSSAVSFDKVEIEDLDILCDSGMISLFGNVIKNNTIETTSGNVGVSYNELPNMLEVKTNSGNVSLYVHKEDSFILRKDTISGSFTSKLEYQKDNDYYNYNEGTKIYKINTNSGNIKILEK